MSTMCGTADLGFRAVGSGRPVLVSCPEFQLLAPCLNGRPVRRRHSSSHQHATEPCCSRAEPGRSELHETRAGGALSRSTPPPDLGGGVHRRRVTWPRSGRGVWRKSCLHMRSPCITLHHHINSSLHGRVRRRQCVRELVHSTPVPVSGRPCGQPGHWPATVSQILVLS